MNIDKSIKPGDVVRLLSGGPKMTVESINYSGEVQQVQCVWFHQIAIVEAGDGKLFGDVVRREFPVDILVVEK